MIAVVLGAVEAAREPITVLWALAGGLVLLAIVVGLLAVMFHMATDPDPDDEDLESPDRGSSS